MTTLTRSPNQLAFLRRARGWSQQDLAARTGLSHSTIEQIELGNRVPRWRTRVLIAAAFNLTPKDLFPR